MISEEDASRDFSRRETRRGKRLEVGGWRLEVGGWRLEVGG
jgi:hypothetical protein